MAVLSALLLPAGRAAASVPAGFDLFETDPQSTDLNFGAVPLPHDFFGPGSDPFTGQVHFGGTPLGAFGGHATGDADTVVQRLGQANVNPPFPSAATVPIEIVALNLVSVEPITVTYAGGQRPELWDVNVGLTPTQPLGQMAITQTSADGGTFSSQLPVSPRLTFTRLSDGQQRTVELTAPPFQSQSSPWRANGCDLPALRIPGLNDSFCPGLTPQGQKVLTIEQAAFARHGVYPVQPSLEHFQCYGLRKQAFRPRQVSLTDQFGTQTTKVRRRAELCNPVQKNQEAFLNTRAHLQCYTESGPDLGLAVAVRNQFGSQRLLVHSAERLCLPTEKRVLPRKRLRGRGRRQIASLKVKTPKIDVPVDHFQCYGVQAQTNLRSLKQPGPITLTDQFGSAVVTLGEPFRLCAPVAKTLGNRQVAVQHPVRHLVCYRISRKHVQRTVQIRNQFEAVTLTTRRPRALCVPSLKLRL